MNFGPPRWQALLCAMIWCAARTAAQDDGAPTEHDVKAAFLYHFTRFVEWPPDTPDDRRRFVVAVLGAEPFGKAVERTLAGKTAGDAPLEVRQISRIEEAEGAKVLFIGASESKHLTQILDALDGRGVLTIGDGSEFAERGGIIGFRTVENKVRLDINLDQATRCGLRISSELLKLARLVRARGGGG